MKTLLCKIFGHEWKNWTGVSVAVGGWAKGRDCERCDKIAYLIPIKKPKETL